MNIKEMKLDDLNPAEYNPRVKLIPGMIEYDHLRKSILEFGFVDPPIYNSQTRNLVGGHQRVQVAKDLGIDSVEVSVVDIPLEKEKQLNIALNKISGEWDNDKLAVLLKEFSVDEIRLTGFSSDEVEDIISEFEFKEDVELPISEDSFDVQSELNKIEEPQTKLGDLYKLGDHFLLCGDATAHSDIEKLMQGNKSDLVVTDPPYNIAVESDSEELEQSGRDTIMNDNMSDEDFGVFLEDVFTGYSSLMSDESAIYVFHSSSYQSEFEHAMKSNNILVRSQCIWVKAVPTFGWSQYRWQHEPCFYAYKKGHAPSWYADRKQSTVWEDTLLPDNVPSTVWRIKRDDVTKYVHPTQKPLALIAIPIRNSSRRGDIVVDLFGGSGSTLITCEELNRKCFTLELDPVFCDIIVKRFEKYTGITAELVL